MKASKKHSIARIAASIVASAESRKNSYDTRNHHKSSALFPKPRTKQELHMRIRRSQTIHFSRITQPKLRRMFTKENASKHGTQGGFRKRGRLATHTLK